MEKNVAVGRRKSSIARVFINKGKGAITVNGKDLKNYFSVEFLQNKVLEPLAATENVGKFDLNINVTGGGIKGQAEAIQMGISRALLLIDEEHRLTLKPLRMLTRDARVVERKKPGFRKARKKEQFSKR
ncbi:MAG: 30S ribosomal protein S9 [Chitinophagales bacterium]|nr:30S ribosomal protein S9 [Bacteroidota bacterium]MCB9256332.1 30S ribosomal protein S9 [Chitinophagales bacterium]